MPKEAMYAMAGVIGFMVIFGIFMATRSVGKARQSVTDIKAGLRTLGLEMVSQTGALSRSQGNVRGYPAFLETDGSGIMAAANRAYTVGMVAHFVSPALSSHTQQNLNQKLGRMAKAGMDAAPMQLRFGITLPRPSGNLEIRKEPMEGGSDLGGGLFARGEAADLAALKRPEVTAALSASDFDVVTVSGDQAAAIWIPANRDYQREMAGSGFIAIADRTFGALASIATALGGR